MKRGQIGKAKVELEDVLEAAKYIDVASAQRAHAVAKRALPSSLLDYLELLRTPQSLLNTWNFKKQLGQFESDWQTHNRKFIAQEITDKQQYFRSIEGHGLDLQQTEAIVIDEVNNLVIAGAGSGKTTTIVGKVKYLVEHQNIAPSRILPISFTKKSAQSLQDRIDIEGIEPKTFHALGFHIIKQVEEKDIEVLDDDPGRITKIFSSILTELIANPDHAATIAAFLVTHLKQQRSMFEFSSLGEYAQFLKDQDFSSYKQVEIKTKGRKTFRNEQVKSVEECMIANYLLFNHIDYEYEANYPYPTSGPYKPDFTIRANEKTIYLEHFGIDREGRVPAFFAHHGQTRSQATIDYQSGIIWKRRTHQAFGTTLLESYSYELPGGALLTNLEAKLVAAGIQPIPMTPNEVIDVIKNSTNRELDGFIELLSTFTSLFKSGGFTLDQIRQRNRKVHAHNPEAFQRTAAFLEVYELVSQKYQEKLAEQNKVDFSDMIAQATQHIANGTFQCPWQYIIIDEFQDMSMGTYRLIRAIQKQNPNVKLFCVGDDWQSIYRFAGSDIGLFTNFEKFFGPTARCFIETTHRFGETLLSTSSNFILKNPHQTKKKLRAPGKRTKVTLGSVSPTSDLSEYLAKTLEQLEKEGLTADNSVLAIGRYKRDFQSLHAVPDKIKIKSSGHKQSLIYSMQLSEKQGETVEIEFLTAHRAKGLEADYVIILNCNAGTMGFPCLRSDDPILSLLLSSADQFENGEERRLFYVAMTRAKKETIILFDNTQPSRFVLEIAKETEQQSIHLCPNCKEGILMVRQAKRSNGQIHKFLGCSNVGYGCNYTEEIKGHTSRRPTTEISI